MNISLPSELRSFVESQIADGRYGSSSEYIRELIRGAQRRQAEQRIESLLLEALEDGEAIEMTKEDWRDIREEALKRIESRRQAS